MNNKRITAFLLLLTIVLLLIGIVGFVFLYQPIPAINDTKLHLFTFSSMEGKTIYTADGKQINFYDCAYDSFDHVSFADDMTKEERFFVRVLSDELDNDSDDFYALSVLTSNAEYLSMEQTVSALSARNNISYVILAVNAALAILSVLMALFRHMIFSRN